MKTFARVQRRRAGAPARGVAQPLRGAARSDAAMRSLLREPSTATAAKGDVSSRVAAGTATGGAPLPACARARFEPRFDRDLGDVRVHTGLEAAASAGALNAHAYTFGRDVVFGAGQYSTQTAAGQRLLAHELGHVVQQTGGDGQRRVRRRPDKTKKASVPAKDPLCASVTTLPELPAGEIKEPEQRLAVIRTLKVVKRCGTAEQQDEYRKKLAVKVGEADAKALWSDADTPFGGYVGMYPEFAPDMKRRLGKLGASETVEFGGFDASGGAATYRGRAEAAATGELPDLARTDILYFRGHQYAQYGAPGVFTSDGTNWVDLRYVEQKGGFANVKLVISTSCATICKEALEVFTGLFPNAAILGYRKSAPIDGKAVRDAFDQKIKGLKRGLLLEQTVDVDAIIAAWKATIQAVHAGETDPVPGYFRAGSLEYWDGKKWHAVSPMSQENKCRRKHDHEYDLPAPV